MMASPKRLKAHELDFGDLGVHDRAHSIMTHWLLGVHDHVGDRVYLE